MPDWITTREAADLLKFKSRRCITQLIKAGRLHGRKFGRVWQVDPASVEEYLEQRGRQTTKSRAK